MATPPYMLIQIIHMQGSLKGQIQEFDSNLITIGRLSTCAVRFPANEPGVSREHARIAREGNQFKLTDVSRFGTFVNGRQVREAYLRNGDVIEFGPGGPKASFSAEIAPSPAVPPLREAAAPSSQQVCIPHPAEAVSPLMVPPRSEPLPDERPAPPWRPGTDEHSGGFGVPVQKTAVPLVIQYGPTIRSFRELPVVLGSDPRSDFVLRHPGISGQHAQILFYQNSYWIKDLTGQGVVRVNQKALAGETRLNPHDEIKCGPEGPIFRFLGEGRLAEVEPPEISPAVQQSSPPGDVPQEGTKVQGSNIISKFLKGFRT